MSLKPLCLSGCAAAALIAAFAGSPAGAAPLDTLDATGFTYQWGFDGVTATENYDRYDAATGAASGDGVNEWNATPTPSAGTVSTSTSLTNTFWVSAAAAASQITTATGYTVEYRIKMEPTSKLLVEATLSGTTAAVTGQLDDTDASKLDLYFDLGSTAGGVRATVAADDFFTLRIAATPDAGKAGGLSYAMYVNGALVADDLDAERTTLTSRRFFIGDTGGSTSGTTIVDYVAFTAGAYAPVPEPASIGLLGAGVAVAVAKRHRRG